MSDLRHLRRRLERRTNRELKHVVLLQWGIYPGIAVGPLGVLSLQRVLAAWDGDILLIFSGWLRKIVEFDPSTARIEFSPRRSSFYARLSINGRRYWVHRDFFAAVEQLMGRVRG